MLVNEIAQKIAPVLENDKSIIFAYLFGSQAKGETNFESDIDTVFI